MNSQPLISIITPSLNSAQHIEQCIASIRLQEYQNIEHIIVDGGSTDGTVSIVKRFEKQYNMRWISERDRSATEAINKGIKMSRGDIVALLPADNLYFPWTTLSVVGGFRENPHAEVVYGDIASWQPTSKYGILDFAPPENRIGATLRFTCLATQSVFFSRKVIDSLGPFDETLTIVSDWDYVIRAWKNFLFHKLDEVLSCSILNPVRESAALQRRIKGAYFPDTSYINELAFSAGYGMRAAEENLTLLANSLSKRGGAKRWSRLIGCEAVSPMGLLGTVLSTWLLYTRHRYQKRFKIGYLKVDKLSQVCFGSRAPHT